VPECRQSTTRTPARSSWRTPSAVHPFDWRCLRRSYLLVIGNGFFQAECFRRLVGNLYSEGSHLKDRAYNIFYMGIKRRRLPCARRGGVYEEIALAFHPAFAVAVLDGVSIFHPLEMEEHIEMADTAAAGARRPSPTWRPLL